jgi:hypothetical protein
VASVRAGRPARPAAREPSSGMTSRRAARRDGRPARRRRRETDKIAPPRARHTDSLSPSASGMGPIASAPSDRSEPVGTSRRVARYGRMRPRSIPVTIKWLRWLRTTGIPHPSRSSPGGGWMDMHDAPRVALTP